MAVHDFLHPPSRVVVGVGDQVLGRTNTHAVWLLLEVGLVLLTIHLVSGSTWLHHLIDLAVPIAGLLGAWWLGQEAEGGRQKAGGRSLLFAVALGAGIAVLLHKPADWVLLVGSKPRFIQEGM